MGCWNWGRKGCKLEREKVVIIEMNIRNDISNDKFTLKVNGWIRGGQIHGQDELKELRGQNIGNIKYVYNEIIKNYDRVVSDNVKENMN